MHVRVRIETVKCNVASQAKVSFGPPLFESGSPMLTALVFHNLKSMIAKHTLL
jgi:hypothetical protein